MSSLTDELRPAAAFSLRAQSFLASAAVVVIACLAYRFSPFAFHRRQFGELYGFHGFNFTGGQYLFSLAAAYLVLLCIYVFSAGDARTSKALRMFRVAAAFLRAPSVAIRHELTPQDRVAVAATLLKAFFGPMMAMSVLGFGQSTGVAALSLLDGRAATGVAAFMAEHWFWLLLKLALFVDVFLFTVGYIVETPRLRNEIRSVDTTLLGCSAALLCYPPFNVITGYVLGSQVSDFPQFDDPTLHAVLNTLLLVLMLLYASATVALGWKASNLTHRGIVGRGPYAIVRHPAYISKNIAWWIGSAPWFAQSFAESWLSGVQAVASMTAWTMLYVLRALTEEDHLRSVDGEYAAYAARVRYRFVPGLV
jgi:protein-S-isoprenylcysteine O-methyltransferase Ste14